MEGDMRIAVDNQDIVCKRIKEGYRINSCYFRDDVYDLLLRAFLDGDELQIREHEDRRNSRALIRSLNPCCDADDKHKRLMLDFTVVWLNRPPKSWREGGSKPL